MVRYTLVSLLIQVTRIVEVLALFFLFDTVSSESDVTDNSADLDLDGFGDASPHRRMQSSRYNGNRDTSAGRIFMKLLPWIIVAILLCLIVPWLYKKWVQSVGYDGAGGGNGGWKSKQSDDFVPEEQQEQDQTASYGDDAPDAGATGAVMTDVDSSLTPTAAPAADAWTPRRQQPQNRGRAQRRRAPKEASSRMGGSPSSQNHYGGDESPNVAWPTNSPSSANNFRSDESPNAAWPTDSPEVPQGGPAIPKKGGGKGGRIPQNYVEKRPR
eukprot:GEMP01036925.1.p1 GENE.GEMP01036925.1~~GEMP01036925.1.p1  ORF type:complete len:270 (+),score=71.15 GEMP01036925.1:79-888(+)